MHPVVPPFSRTSRDIHGQGIKGENGGSCIRDFYKLDLQVLRMCHLTSHGTESRAAIPPSYNKDWKIKSNQSYGMEEDDKDFVILRGVRSIVHSIFH